MEEPKNAPSHTENELVSERGGRKMEASFNFPSSLLPSIDLSYIEERSSGLTTQTLLNHAWTSQNRTIRVINDTSKIYVPSNPRGAETLPPGIVVSESDLYLRRLWGKPSEGCTQAESSSARLMSSQLELDTSFTTPTRA
ncbi:hypothetical protein EJ110_NYTH14567 [Nymphaea thermarum]|nr:hypothetical protein EJ110_NYTH14567 [Nymphaea thermarum]